MKPTFHTPTSSVFTQWIPAVMGIAYFAAFFVFLLTRL